MKIEMCCSCTGRNSNQNVEFQTCRNWRPSQQNTTSNQQPATSNQQPATSNNAGLANQQPAKRRFGQPATSSSAGLANQQPAKRRFGQPATSNNAGLANQQPAKRRFGQPATSKTPVSKTKRRFRKQNAGFENETGVLEDPELRTRPRAKRLNATLWRWRWALRPRAQRWPQDPALWHLAFWSLFLPQQLQHI